SYGILIETRVFGELIPLCVCCGTLILEELLLVRVQAYQGRSLRVETAHVSAAELREAA
ncbi:MAG: hypothetical protein INR62_12180, partial [Rhodospirillales bacterium]|nr:hypothetical protein [Acetobacter sp.]